MKWFYIPVFLLTCIGVNAQKKTDPAELYPVFKSLKVKWDRNMDYLAQAPDFNECINGNCADGEGVRLMTENLELKYSSYTLRGTILKGTFSEGGKRFNGKVYKFSLPAGGDKKEKELRIGTPLNITNEAAMKPFYIGEGSYYAGPDRWNHGWDGEVKDLPSLAKAFPDAVIHKSVFSKGGISWIDVDLPVKHRFIRYTGHTFASGDFMFGKAVLDNGDVYEGFFLRTSFHGPGKLTRRSGKILQGIWQIDSLTQDVAVEFPAALLQAVLPKPAFLKIAAPNDWNLSSAANYYGDVINNEASGWGFWKIDGFPSKMAYGYWQHNQLEGPGIIFTTPTANQLSFESGNKTTWENDFWISTGVYKSGKIVLGNELVTDYSVYYNKEIPASDVQRLSFEKISLRTNPLQGCGMQMDFWWNREERPSVFTLKEGHYINGKLSGFYFENDTAKKRDYDHFKYAGFYSNWSVTADMVKAAEMGNNLCFDVMERYKPLFIVEIKKMLEGNIAAEAWAKSPEGIAHKQRVEAANREYEAKRKKECEADFAKIGVRGRTYIYKGSTVLLEDYDCNKKEFIAWRPRQGNDSYNEPEVTRIRDKIIFESDKLLPSVKQYQTCTACNGTGKIAVTTSTTRVKDLPWGYFSGIETKSIRTTTKEELKTCAVCSGTALMLK